MDRYIDIFQQRSVQATSLSSGKMKEKSSRILLKHLVVRAKNQHREDTYLLATFSRTCLQRLIMCTRNEFISETQL